MTAWIAALPVLLATLLLVGLRWPASRAMPTCAAVTVLCAVAYWQVPGGRVAAAGVEAMVITTSVLLILFGALFLVEQLREVGAVRSIHAALTQLTPDPRLQVLLVAWLLGSFFEGASGFGAPAAITAPLLVALGLSPVLSVVLALVGDSVAVSFGAVGTPMMVGMAQGLVGAPGDVPAVERIAQRITVADLLIGSLVPVLLVLTLTCVMSGRQGIAPGLRTAPFALAIGVSHLGTAAAVAFVLGPELPSIIGPLVGMLVAVLLLRRGWLLPRDNWTPRLEVPAPNDANTEPRDLPSTGPDVGVTRAVLPYAILVGLLIATRAQSLAIGDALRSVSLGWDDVFSTGIRAQLQPLHSPGAIFVAVTLFVPALFGRSTTSLGRSARVAWGKLSRATLPLLAAIVTVRVFVHSGDNAAGLEAMPMVLAGVGAETAGPVWPVLAPWVGALGSFIAGSATFSNMLFAGLQQSVASLHGHAPIDVLALQGMGAAAGNMICIHNVVAASTVVGLSRAEGDVIRRTAPAMIVYLSLASFLGWLSAP